MPPIPMDELKEMPRRQLQALAKEHGLKANAKSALLIEQLSALCSENSDATNDSAPVVVAESEDVVDETLTTDSPTKEPNTLAAEQHEEEGKEKEQEGKEVAEQQQQQHEDVMDSAPKEASSSEVLTRKDKTSKEQESKSKAARAKEGMTENGNANANASQEVKPVENTAAQNANKNTKRRPVDFAKAHERLFSNQQSIAEKYKEDLVRSQRKPKKHPKRAVDAITNNFINKNDGKINSTILNTTSTPKRQSTAAASSSSSVVALRASTPASAIPARIRPSMITSAVKGTSPAKQAPGSGRQPLKDSNRKPVDSATSKRKKFDLTASLNRPVTWQMKKGPLPPVSSTATIAAPATLGTAINTNAASASASVGAGSSSSFITKTTGNRRKSVVAATTKSTEERQRARTDAATVNAANRAKDGRAKKQTAKRGRWMVK